MSLAVSKSHPKATSIPTLLKKNGGCRNCPKGHSHIFFSPISSRTRGTKCPYCRGRRVCAHNCLATISPSVAKFWDHDKNAKTPEEILAGSHVRATWRCPDCSYQWQAPVQVRVSNNSGCPQCSLGHRAKVSQLTFEAAKHHLLDEWDYEQNAKAGIFPHNTTLGSNKRVHWICRKCPNERLHKWGVRASERTRSRQRGCPCCAGMQVCVCNSLQSLCPDIASEFDLDKNDITPADVTWSSNKVVWWRNDKRGSWDQRITARTHKRHMQQT